jgi:hypothetical protein
MPKKSDDQKPTRSPMADLIKRLLDAPYNERITRDELEVLREHLKCEIPGLSTEQLKHLGEIRYWNARQNRIEAEQAALAVPEAEPPPPWICQLLAGYVDAKLDPFDMRRLHGYLEQEVPGLTTDQRLHLSRLYRFNENLRLRRIEKEVETNEVFARLSMSANRTETQETQAGVAAPKRKPTRKPRAARPKTLKELADEIRSKSPRSRNVPLFIEMMDRLIKEDHPVSIHFDDIRKSCHGDDNVDDEAVEKTIKRARQEIQAASLPYTVSKSGHTVVVKKTP